MAEIETLVRQMEAAGLTKEQQFTLVDAMLKLSQMVDPARRNAIVEDLPATIADNIAFDASAKAHVANIVSTCLTYADGLEALLAPLRFYYEGTVQYNALLDVLRTLHGAAAGNHGGVSPTLLGLWNVPPRIENFAGRDGALEALHQRLEASGPGGHPGIPQALCGMGGIGKTSVAIEYAYRHQADFEAIFWFNAATLAEDFSRLGRAVPIPGWDADQEEIRREAALRWLADGGKSARERRWLLIYDNVTDRQEVERYVPTPFGGSILYTTRRNDLLPPKRVLPVELLTEVEALALFEQATSRDLSGTEEREAARELANELGFLPLALAQAVAYIEDPNTGTGFPQYLAAFRKRRLSLLDRANALSDYHLTITTTWAMNFEELETTAPATAELLRCCSLLAPDHIPAALFQASAECFAPPLSGALQQIQDETQWRELAAPASRLALLRYSGASAADESERSTLSIHRLVQEVLRERLRQDGRMEAVAAQVLKAIAIVFPQREPSRQAEASRYLPHLLECSAIAVSLSQAHAVVATLLNWGAIYLEDDGRFGEAEPIYKYALELRRGALPEGDAAIAVSLNNLAELYMHVRNYSAAEPLYKEALEINRIALGENDPQYAVGINNLAALYQDLGRGGEAETLFEEALKLHRASRREGEPVMAQTLNNLAGLYKQQSRYTEAETLYRQAIVILRQAPNRGGAQLTVVLTNLGLLHTRQRKYLDAERVYREALELRCATLRKDHPDIALSLNYLGELCRIQDRLVEAEPLYEEALAIRRASLPASHPGIALSLYNLAELYETRKRVDKAEALYNEALEICRASLPPLEPQTAAVLNNLAGLYEGEKRHEEAEPLYRQAVSILIQAWGTAHPMTRVASANHLRCLRALGRLEAELPGLPPIYREVLEEVNPR